MVSLGASSLPQPGLDKADTQRSCDGIHMEPREIACHEVSATEAEA